MTSIPLPATEDSPGLQFKAVTDQCQGSVPQGGPEVNSVQAGRGNHFGSLNMEILI